jgi:hypothetical protein
MKDHKPCFDVAKLQWLQNPNQTNGEKLKNAERETSSIFRNMKRKYLKEKINYLETNSRNIDTIEGLQTKN